MQVNWTAVSLGIALAIATWFLPNPFTDKCPPMPTPKDSLAVGRIDTVFVEKPIEQGHQLSPSHVSHYTGNLSEIDSTRHGFAIDYNLYEAVLDTTIDGDSLVIRSRTYVSKTDAFTDIEFLFKQRPAEITHSIDTVFRVTQLPCPDRVDDSIWDDPLNIAEVGLVGFAMGALIVMIGLKN